MKWAVWMTAIMTAFGWNAQAQSANLRQAELTVLASGSWSRGMNRNEMKAAMKVWVGIAAQRRGFQLDFRFEVAETEREIQARVQGNQAGLFLLDVFEYLNLPHRELLHPVLAAAEHTERSFLLITRSGEGGKLEDLRGKKVAYYSLSQAELPRKWIEVVLRERGLPRASQFFGWFQGTGRVSGACLPVFFGKADACIVDMASFQTLKELNPQMGKKLQVILRSPPYTECVLALHANYQSAREDLIQGLLEVHQFPEGQQILTIFQGTRVRMLDKAAFATARELKARYDALHLEAEPNTRSGMSGGLP